MVRIISTAALRSASGESFYDRGVDGVDYSEHIYHSRKRATIPEPYEIPEIEPVDVGELCGEGEFEWE